MYAKLIFRNAKRSVRDYSVYIVTMTICVTLFYSFLSISSRYYRPDIGSEYDFTVLSDGMKAAICVITLLLLFLIRFTNRYMLRQQAERIQENPVRDGNGTDGYRGYFFRRDVSHGNIFGFRRNFFRNVLLHSL